LEAARRHSGTGFDQEKNDWRKYMKVILDSNIFIKDFYLSSAPYSRFDELRTVHQIDVFIPRVVVLEVIAKYRERLTSAKYVYEKAVESVNSIKLEKIHTDFTLSIDEQVQIYRDWLDSKISIDWNAEIIPIPNVNHEDIVLRILEGKKPFKNTPKNKDQGYRDFLIWKSVLTKLEADAAIHFLTQNTNDFLDSGVLHPDLLEELDDPNSVIVSSSMHDFTQKYVLPVTEEATRILAALSSGTCTHIDWNSWVMEHFKKYYSNDELVEMFAGDDLSGVDIENLTVTKVASLKFLEVGMLSGNKIASACP